MSTRDLLLAELYRSPRETQALALAARHVPFLRFDRREPFLPLAAGYTIFTADGPSPSFNREIQLRPPGKPASRTAIEYAIWWDWDIHHLYELEHVWVYLDADDQPVRLEASWHGEYHEIPLQLEDGRAVLLSEPGKHAFAPHVDWFLRRAKEMRRVETEHVSLHAGVLVNEMFAGQIRQRVFDQTLVRSYLTQQDFQPTWDFSNRFAFRTDMLVPWATLKSWIPRRVNAWLDRLETSLTPEDYRALRLVSVEGSLVGLQAAAQAGADVVYMPAALNNGDLAIGDSQAGPTIDMETLFHFCSKEPMGVAFEPQDPKALEILTSFIQEKKLEGYALLASTQTSWLAQYRSQLPKGTSMLQFTSLDQDPIQMAQEAGAAMINPRWEGLASAYENLTPEWVQMLHQIGLGIAGWPTERAEDLAAMQRMGLDIIWQPL
jgi:hypothetical protein